jgi:flagellar motor switch protein FliN/FliY
VTNEEAARAGQAAPAATDTAPADANRAEAPRGAGLGGVEESITEAVAGVESAARAATSPNGFFEPAFGTNGPVRRPAATESAIDLLMDVNVTVRVELGRTRKTIADILRLAPGMLVELDQGATENVDLFINDKLLATGEVAVVDGHFAVKITRLVSKAERIRSML